MGFLLRLATGLVLVCASNMAQSKEARSFYDALCQTELECAEFALTTWGYETRGQGNLTHRYSGLSENQVREIKIFFNMFCSIMVDEADCVARTNQKLYSVNLLSTNGGAYYSIANRESGIVESCVEISDNFGQVVLINPKYNAVHLLDCITNTVYGEVPKDGGECSNNFRAKLSFRVALIDEMVKTVHRRGVVFLEIAANESFFRPIEHFRGILVKHLEACKV